MVVAMVADLASRPQQHVAEILEPAHIQLALRFAEGIIAVVFNDRAGVGKAVALRQRQHIRPPDVGVKFRHGGAVIPPQIHPIAAGHRGGKIVQIKRCPVQHRPDAHRLQQAVCSGVKAAGGFLAKSQIHHHEGTLAAGGAPHQRGGAVAVGDGEHLCPLGQLHRPGGVKPIGDGVGFAAADHEILIQAYIVHPRIPVIGGQDAQLLFQQHGAAGFLQCRGKQRPAALLHPVRQRQHVLPQRRQVGQRHHHGTVALQRGQRLLGQIHLVKSHLHVGEDLGELFRRVQRGHIL